MKERRKKKDAGTIFNPVMYLVVLLLTVQLLLLFVEYRRVAWVSGAVTDSMTDALLGACMLNHEELYHYGATDDLEILYPEEKHEVFQEILKEELQLSADLQVTEKSLPLLSGKITITDFQVYSVKGEDITVYTFSPSGSHAKTVMEDARGVYMVENGRVIENTTLAARIGFMVEFFGIPIEVRKYHMVDVKKGG